MRKSNCSKKANWKWHYSELRLAARNHRKNQSFIASTFMFFSCAPFYMLASHAVYRISFFALLNINLYTHRGLKNIISYKWSVDRRKKNKRAKFTLKFNIIGWETFFWEFKSKCRRLIVSSALKKSKERIINDLREIYFLFYCEFQKGLLEMCRNVLKWKIEVFELDWGGKRNFSGSSKWLVFMTFWVWLGIWEFCKLLIRLRKG